ncbi:MAG: hypothetical protein HY952_02495 [Elusimicrobia bacterium]|nr:hypothetical protein [Elusimicrobiota bacterium]
MPWRRRHACGTGKARHICLAVTGAALACVIGAFIQRTSTPLVEQYTRYKQVSSSYSKEEIKKAMEKMAARGR